MGNLLKLSGEKNRGACPHAGRWPLKRSHGFVQTLIRRKRELMSGCTVPGRLKLLLGAWGWEAKILPSAACTGSHNAKICVGSPSNSLPCWTLKNESLRGSPGMLGADRPVYLVGRRGLCVGSVVEVTLGLCPLTEGAPGPAPEPRRRRKKQKNN